MVGTKTGYSVVSERKGTTEVLSSNLTRAEAQAAMDALASAGLVAIVNHTGRVVASNLSRSF